MTKGELFVFIVKELGEEKQRVKDVIMQIISENDNDYIMRLLEDAKKLHNAGVRVKDGSRQRTLGGCFFFVHKYRKLGKL